MKLRSLLIGGMLLAVALGGAIAVSQNIRKAHYRGEGFMGGRMLEFFADYLDLTDAQQAQAKEIMAKEKPALQPLLRQRIQAEKQLRELAMNGNFDDSKVRDIANQQAQVVREHPRDPAEREPSMTWSGVLKEHNVEPVRLSYAQALIGPGHTG